MYILQYIEHYQKIMVITSLTYTGSQHISLKAEQDPDYYVHKEILVTVPKATISIFSVV